MPPTPRLAQEVLRTRTAAYSISVLKQHKTRVFFVFGVFGGSVNDRIALRARNVLQNSTRPSFFLFWCFGGSAGDRIAH